MEIKGRLWCWVKIEIEIEIEDEDSGFFSYSVLVFLVAPKIDTSG